MKLLIVGGSGVLSSAVAKCAVRNNIDVTLINRGHREQPEGCNLIKADKDNLSLISEKIGNQKFDAVIDFLCYNDEQTKKSFSFYKDYAKQYIFVSTCAVFDKTIPGIKTEESPKGLKIWSYSLEKVASEKLVLELAKANETSVTIVRPCVTYDDTRIPYGIMPPYRYHWTLCARILAGKPIITWNNGNNRSNMMRVEDFAVGVVGLIGNYNAYNEAFNICGDEMPTFNDVLDAVGKKLNKEVIKIDITPEFYAANFPSKKGEILGGRAIDATNSNEKIKRFVPSFKQTISLDEGVSMTIDAYRTNNYQKGIDWTFDAISDRIIKKWCEKNNISSKKYKLGFLNYLGNASFSDKYVYYQTLYSDNYLIKFVRKFKCILKY